MKKIFSALSLCVVLSFPWVNTAHGALITSSASFFAPTIIDFSQFGSFTFTSGPVQVGGLIGEDVTWETNSSNSVIGTGGYGLGSNGSWTSPETFVGSNGSGVSMIFSFNSGPLSAVGGFINYAPGHGDVLIEALDNLSNVLEAYDISALAPIATVGGNDGAFRGIVRGNADIWQFRVSNSYVVLDDLTFTREFASITNNVPEPGTLAIFGIGLAGLGFMRRRRKA